MASTIFFTLRMLSTEPTDVPPNFNTFIDMYLFSWQSVIDNRQFKNKTACRFENVSYLLIIDWFEKKETQVQCENCNKAGRGLRICLFVYAKPPKGSLSVPRCDMWNLLMSFAIFLVFIFTSAILRIIFQMQAFFCLKVEIWQKKVRYHAKKKDVVLTGLGGTMF